MKNLLLLSVLGAFLLAGCTTQPAEEFHNPLVGFWELQSADYSWGDTSVTWMMDEMNAHMKVFGMEHWGVIVLQPADKGEGTMTAGGVGTYTLMGDTLTETVGNIYPDPGMIGMVISYKVTFMGDSLIQEGPISGVPEEWEGFQLREVYIRAE